MSYNIIIIGAGAAGLMAAKELSATGYHVHILEAAEKAGGRMATLDAKGFEQPVETGAEFVHGNLPLTLQLLKEGNIPYHTVEGAMINIKNGVWHANQEHESHWEELMQMLHSLKEDMTIGDFLNTYFSAPEYALLREGVQRFAEGFDLADINNASALFVKEEWSHEEEDQYRVDGGYIKLAAYLLKECVRMNTVIHYYSEIKSIEYTADHLRVYTTDRKSYSGDMLIVTVSLGVLQSGSIAFHPALTKHRQAIAQIGFGAVIKIVLQFKKNLWKKFADDIGFLLTDEKIPAWWTQAPVENNVLTGWFGGQKHLFNH
ncbi:MAG: FAD-dependent oxidoreductase [Agriterribacter sp.]